jgi:hypothetical protein
MLNKANTNFKQHRHQPDGEDFYKHYKDRGASWAALLPLGGAASSASRGGGGDGGGGLEDESKLPAARARRPASPPAQAP